jgi:hypothetical protein
VRRPYQIATAAAVLGSALLIYWLGVAKPLWVDEEMLALNVRDRTFQELAGPLWLNQSAPFGWLVLERLLMLTLGTGERAVRLLTVLFGIGTLAAATWIGRRWLTPLGAVVLVSMCAFGEWIVFFTLELKHYSGDTFWALLLPALAAWSLEHAENPRRANPSIAMWWFVAAVGMWFGNGAVFVAPGCAVALVLVSWRRGGWRRACWSAVPSLVWFASFAADYTLVLRHALANPVLDEYWAFAFPPVKEGIVATVRYLASVAEPFAVKPVGSGFPFLFWIAWATGVVIALLRHQTLGLMIATVPVSMVVLALLHIIPIFERLSLWTVPSLYIGVGLCADAAVWLVRIRRGKPLLRYGIGAIAGIAALTVAFSVVWRGGWVIVAKAHHSNYDLDDRNSIRRLLADHRAGDAIATTHFGLVALWWYGEFSIADGHHVDRLPDGSSVFELRHVPPEGDCTSANAELESALRGRDRVSVYLGFRMNVLPEGFDALVMRELRRRGTLVAFKPYANKSEVAIFDVGGAPAREQDRSDPLAEGTGSAPIADGCVTVVPARRW